jgi:hypothetical protein
LGLCSADSQAYIVGGVARREEAGPRGAGADGYEIEKLKNDMTKHTAAIGKNQKKMGKAWAPSPSISIWI